MSCRIYKYQAHGYAFSRLEELLHSLGGDAFVNMTHRSVAESLLEVGVTQRFIDDVIVAVLRASYGQSVLVPAFAGESQPGLLIPDPPKKINGLPLYKPLIELGRSGSFVGATLYGAV